MSDQKQFNTASGDRDLGMTDAPASTGTHNGMGEALTNPGETAPHSENAANSAAPMTRGGATRQTGGARDATTTSSGVTGVRHVHEQSGYEWEKDEDAPGYGWKNRKAREEHARAMEAIVGKERMIGAKYGDLGL